MNRNLFTTFWVTNSSKNKTLVEVISKRCTPWKKVNLGVLSLKKIKILLFHLMILWSLYKLYDSLLYVIMNISQIKERKKSCWITAQNENEKQKCLHAAGANAMKFLHALMTVIQIWRAARRTRKIFEKNVVHILHSKAPPRYRHNFCCLCLSHIIPSPKY